MAGNDPFHPHQTTLVRTLLNRPQCFLRPQFHELNCRTDQDSVEIIVADTGPGISPRDKDNIFLPHFSTKDRGTGLGLAIAARIVSEHGGGLRVEDNFPTGSRFILELPAADILAHSDRPSDA